jgi:hypothetical protein
MADDVVDTIAQYDLDDDFPDYANEQNKELNQIVSAISLILHTQLNSLNLPQSLLFHEIGDSRGSNK